MEETCGTTTGKQDALFQESFTLNDCWDIIFLRKLFWNLFFVRNLWDNNRQTGCSNLGTLYLV